ncbi:very large A-kinase anchor protein isoform X2 [Varanus komodoensis]|uniref:very large A-kinase anchor protein isoform X2 n=1 Tax=Varanus komodoensis TaxID=61221 RepID=UPI001CF7A40C|nr:very large A-kinase anchor protein isoform X2 [Varanus komodoensis]
MKREEELMFDPKENETTSALYHRKESNPLPELLKISVCENKNLSTEELSRSTTQEELKKASSLPSLAHEGKTASTDRQIKEGFFQYLGSLFGIASKPSYTESEQSTPANVHHKAGHEGSGHTEHHKTEIFVISTFGSEQGASNRDEDINFARNTSSGSQDLQEAQKQSAEVSKKTEYELCAPAVTYATYRGSARIKQLLKKQAKLEQDKENLTSINISVDKTKGNQAINVLNSEVTTTKTGFSLKKKSKSETKDDEKDSQANIFSAEMNLGKNPQDILDSREHKEQKNIIALSAEMETIKNCIEELVSVKHGSVSNTPEFSRSLLLEPILLPKEANLNCQNKDTVKMCSENSSLVEKTEEILGEIQMQLQSNNAAIIGVQKEMHSCNFPFTETKETVKNGFPSLSQVGSTDSEHQLLEDECSCNSLTQNQFKLKLPNQTLYLNSTISDGQVDNRTVNRNEDSLIKVLTEQKEQTLQIISPDMQLPLHEQRVKEELVLVLQDRDCNKALKETAGIVLPTAAQPTETVKDILSKNSPESDEFTEPVLHTGIQNSTKFSVISEIETNSLAKDTSAVEFDHIGMTNVLPNATEINNTNHSLLAVEYENVESQGLCSFLKMEDNSIVRGIVPLDDALQNFEAKHGSCSHLSKKGENVSLIKTSNNLDVAFPSLELEKTKPINSKVSATIVKPIPSALKMTEESPSPVETKEFFTVSPSKDMHLPKDLSPIMKSENNSFSVLSSPLPDPINNSFIFKEQFTHLDTRSKPVPTSEDQCLLEASCSLFDKPEGTNHFMRAPAEIDSAENSCGKVNCSFSICENNQDSAKLETSGPWNPHFAAEPGKTDQSYNVCWESGSIIKTKLSSEAVVKADTREKILPCSEEIKDITGSCSVDSRSMMVKEDLPVLENVYPSKPPSPLPCFKGISTPYPTCEILDVNTIQENNSLMNSETDLGNTSTKHKLNRLPFESTSKVTHSEVLLVSEAEAIEPAKMILGMEFTTQQRKEEHRIPLGQLNLHYLATATAKGPAKEHDQAITGLFKKSSKGVFEEPLKHVETGKQVQIKSQDLTLLLKKADEIVDSVLHLAMEEIRSKQTAGACQTNDIKDNLLEPSLQKDLKRRKMLSESKEIQSRNSSLKHFNESCIKKLSGVKGEDILGTDIQDENILFDITDKNDLYSSIALKAKEIIDDVINAAKLKLTYFQDEVPLTNGTSQNIHLDAKTEALNRLPADSELKAKLPKIIKEPLNLDPVYPTAIDKITSKSEIESSSAALCIDSKENSKAVTGEVVASNAFSCQTIGDKWSDPTTTLEYSPTETGNGKYSRCENCTTHMIDAGDNTSNLAADNKFKDSLNVIQEEIVTAEMQLPSSVSVPVCWESGNIIKHHMLTSNSNNDMYTHISYKFKGDCGPLSSLQNDLVKDLPKYMFKEAEAVAVVREGPLTKYYEIESNRGYGNMKKTCTVSQDKNRFGTQFSLSESSVTNSSAKNGLNLDFANEEKAVTEPSLTVANVLNKYFLDADGGEDGAFSSPKEREGNSSFTILYDGALQDESYCSSTEEPEHALPLSDFSLDNNQHLLMAETEKGTLGSAQLYEESDQLNNILDSTCSESFMVVEAKRYKVYPFSLSPIYEDDSSQEDLLSTDISPRNTDEKSRDNQSLSVLSLLQSVSERLKSSNQCNEEEEEDICEENEQDEKDACILSHWPNNSRTAKSENIYERHSDFLSKQALGTEEALSFSSTYVAQPLQKSESVMKSFPKSVYYECLQSSRSYSSENGTRFGSMLFPKDQQPESNVDLQRLAPFQVCPVDREKLKCNPRPGKMVICDVHGNTNKYEIYHDVLNAMAWVFSKEALIRVVRGCWILYEKPGFQGQKYVVEEGEKMLNEILNPHSEKYKENFIVGSIRQIVKDSNVPEIQLYPQNGTDNSPICIQTGIADLEELEIKNTTFSVKAGVWLAYSDVNYKGEVQILEENHSPYETSAADLKSLYPLKMGGLKVQMPMNIKVMIYERPQFGGWCKDLSENIDCVPMLFENPDDFQGIGSIRVIGGIWVGYTKERYKGQQYLLEEGEYENWQSWGAVSGILLSLRFLQADFVESEVTLFEMDEENGKLLKIANTEIPDLERAGFGLVTRSIDVKSGVWVAYQQKYFCGEQYILEKGKYKCFFDWGGASEIIMSIRPIKLEPLGNHEPIHWIKAFSNAHFQGSCVDFTTEVADFASFTPCSFKVLRGSWLLHYLEETADYQCVLEEGLYADLASCGCPAAVVKSLEPIEYVFAEPSISLFALENCEGRELHLQEAVSSILNKNLHFPTQSVWVRSGLWIAYEGCNFLGKQFLLKPSKISNWTQLSRWKLTGSLRPVKQPAVYFRIKNRSQGKFLTVAGNLMDARATSVCLSPLNGENTQIWSYSCGLIKSKVNDACLDVIGGRDVPGAKVALWVEHGKERQKWMLNKDGTIGSYLHDQLVLDIKGGHYYDRNHIIVNLLDTSECTQKWDFEIL